MAGMNPLFLWLSVHFAKVGYRPMQNLRITAVSQNSKRQPPTS